MCAPWSHSPRCLFFQQQRDREIIGADTLLGACPREHNALQRTLDLMGKEDRGSPVLIFPSNPSASTATAPPQRKRGRCCEERRWKLPPQREFSPPARSSQKTVYPERALDLGNTGGNRANPSPTRPPDLCAIPVISLTAVPQQQRDWEIIGADTLLGACPADAGSDGKGR